jgi:hypothetical protein
MRFIGELLNVLSATVNACEDFFSINGDYGYFYRTEPVAMSEPRTQEALRAIAKMFKALKLLQQRLTSLDNICKRTADAVSLSIFPVTVCFPLTQDTDPSSFGCRKQ